mgnify:CR=1 FL=1
MNLVLCCAALGFEIARASVAKRYVDVGICLNLLDCLHDNVKLTRSQNIFLSAVVTQYLNSDFFNCND